MCQTGQPTTFIVRTSIITRDMLATLIRAVGDDLTGGGTVRVCEKGRGTLRSGRQAMWTTNASSQIL